MVEPGLKVLGTPVGIFTILKHTHLFLRPDAKHTILESILRMYKFGVRKSGTYSGLCHLLGAGHLDSEIAIAFFLFFPCVWL